MPKAKIIHAKLSEEQPHLIELTIQVTPNATKTFSVHTENPEYLKVIEQELAQLNQRYAILAHVTETFKVPVKGAPFVPDNDLLATSQPDGYSEPPAPAPKKRGRPRKQV
jgi:hypothetical protein